MFHRKLCDVARQIVHWRFGRRGSLVESERLAPRRLAVSAALFERLQATDRRKYGSFEPGLGEDSVLLFVDMGVVSWLRRDGFVLTLGDDDAPRFVTEDELVTAIVIGSKTLEAPELLELLPARPDEARDCDECEGARRVEYPVKNSRGEPLRLVCAACWGRGWKVG